jgi:hypothetical protein
MAVLGPSLTANHYPAMSLGVTISPAKEPYMGHNPRLPRPAALHLRLAPELQVLIQQAADAHHTTLSNEIRLRLIASFERDNLRALEDIKTDMEICWARWSARTTRMDLADQLADAVVRGTDPQSIQTIARLIVRHRDEERRAVLGGAA